MVTSIWEDLKREFSHGSILTRLIIINASVFVIINLVKIFLSIGGVKNAYYNDILHFFCISSDLWHDLTHPWAFITHMFLHESFWHILWNMLFLYWFGRIISDLIGERKILGLYILGGLAGVLAYLFGAIVLQVSYAGPYALGASGAVMAIVVASGTLSPDYSMRLLFIGDVKLKYIVIVLVFLDLIAIADNSNTGGHFAHLGGAFFGWLFITRLRQGYDYSVPVNNFFDRANDFFRNLFSKESSKKPRRPRVVYRNTKIKNSGGKGQAYAVSDEEGVSHQEQLDAILDKIKKTGYDSLSSEEKEFLFNASKKK